MSDPLPSPAPVDLGADRLGAAGDAVYAALVAAHADLDAAASAALDARLVLLLANLVGDPTAIHAAIARARAGLGTTRTVSPVSESAADQGGGEARPASDG